MKSVAFFNNKGGVGKTTLLCNIASYLSFEMKKRVLVIDADPQCNATQLLLDEQSVIDLYDAKNSFTIHSVIHPLSIGKGYSDNITPLAIPDYGVDLIPGDPRLALKEDLLSKDWQDAIAGEVRGLRTSLLFNELLERCGQYDFVFFDMGPSLGSINRAVLLACDFFVSPMSIDIFSLKAIENITTALIEWQKKLANGLKQIDEELVDDIPAGGAFDVQFAGYVAQQYIQRTRGGESEAVAAYDTIKKKIPAAIDANFLKRLKMSKNIKDYELGAIPNLHSLIPMSQTAHKPIFALKAKDGVRGAHFNRVRDAGVIYKQVSSRLLKNILALS